MKVKASALNVIDMVVNNYHKFKNSYESSVTVLKVLEYTENARNGTKNCIPVPKFWTVINGIQNKF